MRGRNVYYPMGFDDNGLPTERLVEKTLGISARDVGRQAFTEICLKFAAEAEEEYRDLWRRLGLSVDWRATYRTISREAQRAAQQSFVDLFHQGRVYRSQAPAIWCPECHAAFAQADLEDRLRESEFVTLLFSRQDGGAMEIATTRPELLAACVAVFVHPDDPRYRSLVGQALRVPFYGQEVQVLADRAADPKKGTGAVMCCTFGDQTDVYWQRTHKLPFVEAIDEGGKMTAATGAVGGLPVMEARRRIKELLAEQGLVLARQSLEQSIRVHERCDTPVEFRIVDQWFVRVLDEKERFLRLGEQLNWRPEFMRARYRAWVENLSWDWAISRQRSYGVPFPAWFCQACGETVVARAEDLPVDPMDTSPAQPCRCGGNAFTPDGDRMDTWATSSLTPLLVSGWIEQPDRFARLFPLTLRPQAHEIIRNWLFYSIVMAWYHHGRLPWSDVLISGWGIAGEGMAKISKSRGGGPMPPLEMIQRYSADALRYWAASTSPGRDAIISEEKIQLGSRLVTKLWNVARFSEPFLSAPPGRPDDEALTPADRWILVGCAALVEKVTAAFDGYEYAAARGAVEDFFWRDLADNYVEMAKLRLYDPLHPAHAGARYALRQVLKTVLKLFAPLFPFVTEAIWLALFQEEEGGRSIHRSRWPEAAEVAIQPEIPAAGGREQGLQDLALGELLLAIATAARRFKSERSLSLGSELGCLQLETGDAVLSRQLTAAIPDMVSVTRARSVEVVAALDPGLVPLAFAWEGVRAGLHVG
jgi:valyl-tRNA synthetase